MMAGDEEKWIENQVPNSLDGGRVWWWWGGAGNWIASASKEEF